MIKKSILIICPFPQGVAAGQRLKYEQYFKHWQKNGYKITVFPFMDIAMWKIVYSEGNYILKILGTLRGYLRRVHNLFYISRYDVVYIHMWVTPFGTTLFERITRKLSRKLIYDIEDNAIMGVDSDVNSFVQFLKNPNKINFLIRRSDHVITSSPSLNDYCLNLNDKKKCTYISSSVDTDIFLPVNKYKNDKKIVIGWTGTFSSKKYLNLLRPVFIELSKQFKFKLLIIGNFEYDILGVDLEVIQWSKKNEVKDLQRIDIGVYPLSKDEGVLGKSGLKAIQYMAFGLPTVATDIGTTSIIIKHKENGYLVNSEEEWLHSLGELIRNPELRKRLGSKARELVVQSYSINATKMKYLSIISKD